MEHLNIWVVTIRAEENPDPSRCHIVVDIIQLEFATEKLDMKCTWATVVLINKGVDEYYRIVLV